MALEFRRIETSDDRLLAYRLRYAAYAVEEGIDLDAMDHTAGILRDDMDDDAVLFGAFEDRALVATARIVPLSSLPDGHEARAFYGSDAIPVPEVRQAIFGRLIVRASHRGSGVLVRMLRLCHDHVLRHGFEILLLDSSPRHLTLYESLGCCRYGRPTTESPYGLLVPMIFPVRGGVSAPGPRSKVLYQDNGAPVDPALAHWLAASRTTGPAEIGSREWRAESTQLLLDILASAGCLLFQALKPAEAFAALRQAAVVEVPKRTRIIAPKASGTELYVILEGRVLMLDTESESHPLGRIVGPGQVLGERSFLRGSIVPTSYKAASLDAVKLLCIGAEVLGALRSSHPEIAAKFLFGLCRTLSQRPLFAPSREFRSHFGSSRRVAARRRRECDDDMDGGGDSGPFPGGHGREPIRWRKRRVRRLPLRSTLHPGEL